MKFYLKLKSNLKRYLKYIGPVILAVILFRTDWGSLAGVFSDADYEKLIWVYLLIIPKNIINSYRWHILLKRISIKRKYWDNFKLYFSGLLTGVITPGRIGEFYRIFRLEKEGYSKIKTAFSIFLTRFFDLSLLVVMGFTGIYYFLNITRFDDSKIKLVLLVGVVLVILFFGFIFIFKSYFAEKIYPVVNRIFKLETTKEGLKNNLKSINLDLFLKLSLLTVIFWLIYFYQLYLISTMLDINISFLKLIFIFPIVSLAAALPVTIVGLGTRELAMINLLLVFGVVREKSLALSFMNYTILLVNMVVCTGMWFLEHKEND
ncbi:MAG: lysylphosphatidylglycerol synthase transmembrane domain-containing protein [Elusimicrobiota bacterium]